MSQSLTLDRTTYNDVRGSFNKYRSVAFGTWKPGEARRFLDRKPNRITCLKAGGLPPRAASEQPEDLTPHGVAVMDFDEISESPKTEPICLHQCAQTTPSLSVRRRTLPATKSPMTTATPTPAHEPDCFSSIEYLDYCLAHNGYRAPTKMTPTRYAGMNRSMDALNDRLVYSDVTRSLRLEKHQKPSTSASSKHLAASKTSFCPPGATSALHKRTRSFDGATRFAVIAPGRTERPSTFGQKNSNSKSNSALQATKNFLKKLYTNGTTLPKRLRSASKSQSSVQHAEDVFRAATSPFYEIHLPEPEEVPFLPYNIQYQIDSDDEGNGTELDIATEELDSSATASCSSTNSPPCKSSVAPSRIGTDDGVFSGGEDKSISGNSEATNRSFATTTDSGRNSLKAAKTSDTFKSWSDLFGHLKQELLEMRARDAQILESLRTVESQLSYVKNQPDQTPSASLSPDYAPPLARMLNSPLTIPAGSRLITRRNDAQGTFV